MDISRRRFMTAGAAAAAGSLAAMKLGRLESGLYVPSQYTATGNLYNSPNQSVREYLSQRAQDILITNGPDAVEKLGLDKYLIGSRLERTLLQSGILTATATTAYHAVKSGYAHTIYDATLKVLRDKSITRRQFLTYASLVSILAGACSKTPTSPAPIPCTPPQVLQNGACTTPSPPDSGKGSISGNVSTLYNKTVDGPIQFLDRNEQEIAKGTIQGGNYSIQNIDGNQISRIARVRIGGGLAGIASYIVTELNAGKTFVTGNNSADYKVGDRSPGVLTIYDNSVRARLGVGFGLPAGSEGNKKPDGVYTFWADLSSDVSGNGRMNPDARLKMTEDAVRYTCENNLLQPFESGITFQKSISPPVIGNNNIIIKYETPYANSASNWVFADKYKLRGSQVEIASPTATNVSDLIELAAALRFFGETDDYKPSVANNNLGATPQGGNLQPVDFAVRDLSNFETFGTRPMTLDVLVESWEQMI